MASVPTPLPTWAVDGLNWIDATLLHRGFWLGVLVGGVIVVVLMFIVLRRRYRTTSLSVSLPFGLGSLSLDNSAQDRVLAWRMYVQLKTRKVALPFDEQCDVIADVYASMREVFEVCRGLLADMPLSDIERPKSVSDLLLRVLNDGIRPHLTRWQAPFRAWWDQQLNGERNTGCDPRELQRRYPEYAKLVEDLKGTNTELSKFAEELPLIARADRRNRRKLAAKPTPEMPSAAPAPAATAKVVHEAIPVPQTPYIPATATQCEGPPKERRT
jgi:hypothetical protein